METREVIARLKKAERKNRRPSTTAAADYAGMMLSLLGLDDDVIEGALKKSGKKNLDALAKVVIKATLAGTKRSLKSIEEEAGDLIDDIYYRPLSIEAYKLGKEPVIVVVEDIGAYSILTTRMASKKIAMNIKAIAKKLGIEASDLYGTDKGELFDAEDKEAMLKALDIVRI